MSTTVHRDLSETDPACSVANLQVVSAGVRHSSGDGTAFSAVAPSKRPELLPTARAPINEEGPV